MKEDALEGAQVRIAALGGDDPVSIRATRRAALTAGADLVAELRAGSHLPFVERAALLRSAHPDAVLVQAHGGDVDAVVDLVEALRAGCADQEPRPLAIVGGDERAVPRVRAALAPLPVEVIPDVRGDEGIVSFRERVRALRRGGEGTLVLRDEAVEELARALAAEGTTSALVLDVSGRSTSIVHATPEGALRAVHLRPLGVGAGADRVAAKAGLDRIRRWIPWAVDSPTLLERVFNRARWPDAVPADPLALALEMALAHEALVVALAEASLAGKPLALMRGAPVVVVTGRLATFPRRAQSLSIPLDVLEPSDVVAMGRARDDSALSLASVAARARRAGADLPTWSPWPAVDRLALVAHIATRKSATVTVSTAAGRREVVIDRGRVLTVSATGPVELTAAGAQLRASGEAGTLGIVLDARPRPLTLPPRDAERVPTVAGWLGAIGAWSV